MCFAKKITLFYTQAELKRQVRAFFAKKTALSLQVRAFFAYFASTIPIYN